MNSIEMHIDLHTHSTASDGTSTPAELVELAVLKGLKAVAITDHDSLDGIETFLSRGAKFDIETIPGVEIGANYSKGTLHILGYYLDYYHPILINILKNIQKSRCERNVEIIKKLSNMGFEITLDEVKEEALHGVVHRPHFASLLLKKGYVRSIAEAFSLYLGENASAFTDRMKLNAVECIKIISQASGIPVLAHPRYLEDDGLENIKNLVKELVNGGLKGIEVYYPTHSKEQIQKYLEIAREFDLIVTGGSDYHGATKPEFSLGSGPEGMKISYELLKNMKDLRQDYYVKDGRMRRP